MTCYVELTGSHRSALSEAEAEDAGGVDPHERISLTLMLRRKAELPAAVLAGERTLTLTELQRDHGADPEDGQRVIDVLTREGVTVDQVDLATRRVFVSAELSTLSEVFGAQLGMVNVADSWTGAPVQHRYRSGALQVPEGLSSAVTGVLGLDNRPQARAHLRLAGDAAGQGFPVPELAKAYSFCDGDGTGQTVAILELGGGYTDKDLAAYFTGVNIPKPSVRAVEVDGGKNAPTGDPNSADGEVLLDIEIVGALAPKAQILVYFAPNTDQGFLDALTNAVHADPAPAAVSISWGGPEDSWTQQARTSFDSVLADAAARGIVVLAAAGDGGSTDGVTDGKQHVDYPASSPNTVGCGGTHLEANADGTVTSETVWKGANGGATGGGISAVYPLPDYQARVGVTPRADGGSGRGVPDVAANADPSSGYQVVVDGAPTVVGGTSAVAPLMAALVCRLVQQLGKPIGPLQQKIYAGATSGQAAAGFRDITSGDNGAYHAAPGWDPCTGLGVPDGAKLLELLRTKQG